MLLETSASDGGRFHIPSVRTTIAVTSIGDGVVNGKQMLDDAQAAPAPDYDVTAMVVAHRRNVEPPAIAGGRLEQHHGEHLCGWAWHPFEHQRACPHHIVPGP